MRKTLPSSRFTPTTRYNTGQCSLLFLKMIFAFTLSRSIECHGFLLFFFFIFQKSKFRKFSRIMKSLRQLCSHLIKSYTSGYHKIRVRLHVRAGPILSKLVKDMRKPDKIVANIARFCKKISKFIENVKILLEFLKISNSMRSIK